MFEWEGGKRIDPDPRKLPGEKRYLKGEWRPYIFGEHRTKVRIKREGGGRVWMTNFAYITILA